MKKASAAMPYITTVSTTHSSICDILLPFCRSSGFWGTEEYATSRSSPVSPIPAMKIDRDVLCDREVPQLTETRTVVESREISLEKYPEGAGTPVEMYAHTTKQLTSS